MKLKTRYNISVFIQAISFLFILGGMINSSIILIVIGILILIINLPFLFRNKLDYYRHIRESFIKLINLVRDKDK